MPAVTVEREFVDEAGGRWRASYTDAGIRGLVTMSQVVFRSLDGEGSGSERYLNVHPEYLERANEQQLKIALSQAQPVDPPR